MHNKDKVILDKKLPYKYNFCFYILEELYDKGVIDVFEMTQSIILLKKKYKVFLSNKKLFFKHEKYANTKLLYRHRNNIIKESKINKVIKN